MADARTAAGSVLGAVNETALTLTAAVTVVSGSVQMLNAFIAKERIKQADRDVIEMSDYRERLIEDAAVETTRRNGEIAKWLSADPDRKEVYEKVVAKYQDLFKNKAEGE